MKDLHTLDQYRVDMRHVFGTMGDGGNGAFKVFVQGKSFFCIASNGGGWEHVSVSPGSPNRKKCPTWDESETDGCDSRFSEQPRQNRRRRKLRQRLIRHRSGGYFQHDGRCFNLQALW